MQTFLTDHIQQVFSCTFHSLKLETMSSAYFILIYVSNFTAKTHFYLFIDLKLINQKIKWIILYIYLSNMALQLLCFWISHRIIKTTKANSVNRKTGIFFRIIDILQYFKPKKNQIKKINKGNHTLFNQLQKSLFFNKSKVLSRNSKKKINEWINHLIE